LSLEGAATPEARLPLDLTESAHGVTLTVRVQPRSRRDAIEGEVNGALRVRLTAPPAEDRANQACCRFLAEVLNIPPSAVSITSGHRGRTKRIRIKGVDARRIKELAAATTP